MNYSKLTFFAFSFLLIQSFTIIAQQDAHYTQYMYNQNVLNPGYAGSRETLSLNLLARSQWSGFTGSPNTYTLSLHAPISKKIGLGLSVIHDEIGPVKEDNLYVDFSYSISLSNKEKLALGIKTGVTLLNVKPIEGLEIDQVLNEPIQKSFPNFGAGLFYFTNHFYAGFSIPNFLNTRHLETKEGLASSASEKKHYFFTSGYVFNVNDKIKLKPSTMIKATSGAPLSIDLSVNTWLNEKFEFGFNYRIEDSVSGIFAIQVTNDLRLGYAYDYTTSNLGEFNSGSHEIMVLFDFNILESKLKSPRYF